MNIWEKLAYYCPRPIKRRYTRLERLAVSLHLPLVRIRSFTRMLTPLVFESFIVSVVLVFCTVSIGSVFGTGNVLNGDDIVNTFGALLYPLLFLFVLALFGFLWYGIHSLMQEVKRRQNKILLCTVCLLILLPPIFTAGLSLGAFDSITMLNGSIIDTTSCTAWLLIKNNGPTNCEITKVQIGGLVCNLSSTGAPILHSGETWALSICYDQGCYQIYDNPGSYVWSQFHPGPNGFGSPFELNMNVTPTTLTGGNYPVTIYTDRVTCHKFEVEAEPAEPEQINRIQVGVFNLHEGIVNGHNVTTSLDLFVIVNMTSASVACIYSMQIQNVTIRFDPPIFVPTVPENMQFSFILSFDSAWMGVQSESLLQPTIAAIPSRPIDSSFFVYGQEYNVTFRTMTNNNYTAILTIIPTDIPVG